VRPRAFVPVHGTIHHLVRHGELARELGVPSVCVVENGDVVGLRDGVASNDGRVKVGRVHTWATRDLPASVIKDRIALAQEGIVLAVVPIDARGALAGKIALASRGVIDETLDARLLEDARSEARQALGAALAGQSARVHPDDAQLAEVVRLAVRRSLARTLGFKPMVVVSMQRLA
jgi:ribonuclease J